MLRKNNKSFWTAMEDGVRREDAGSNRFYGMELQGVFFFNDAFSATQTI
jgi:hypothetical protein